MINCKHLWMTKTVGLGGIPLTTSGGFSERDLERNGGNGGKAPRNLHLEAAES